MNVSVGAKTDVGRVRGGNEDSYLAEAPLFGVADGMGGHTGGEVASGTAVDVITRTSKEAPPADIDDLATYVKRANEMIWQKAQEDPSLHGMGTTCTLLHITGSTVQIAHVGDSRAYLLRQDELSQITEDHTLVERMVREGRISREDAPHHPQRSIITRALGVDAEVEVDTTTIEVQAGDRILVCSDGLSSMLDDPAIKRLLQGDGDAQVTAEELVEAANEAGGEDNITVVVLDFDRELRAGVSARLDTDALPDNPAAPPPEATDDALVAQADDREEEGRGRWGRRVATVILGVALVAGMAYFGATYALDRMWFVGATGDGQVAIFNGLPEDVLGLTLREVVEESEVTLDDLSVTYRSRVQEGLKADSREDALQKISDMAEQSERFTKDRPSPEPEQSTKSGNTDPGDGKD